MKFGQKIQEWFYMLSTIDKYSEWDSRKSFNRLNKPETSQDVYNHHNQSTSRLIGGGGEDAVYDTQLDETVNRNIIEGVHEVKLAWRHIKNWIDKYDCDIGSSLQSKCTQDDLIDFQKDLNIRLPNCVVEFYKLTDGQGNYGNNSEINGLLFGLKLLPLDEILINCENWRKLAKILNENHQLQIQLPQLQLSHNNSNQLKKSSPNNSFELSNLSSSSLDQKFSNLVNLNHQKSIPPNHILETYAHPMWIPLITDEIGNFIGIDLSPPPQGKWGQVIMFGRDFDTKFKIADNFGDFLLLFANDLEIGNWNLRTSKKNNDGDLFIGNENELYYVDKETNLEQPYLSVLRNRAINNWINTLKSNNEPISPENNAIIKNLLSKDKTLLEFKPDNVDEFINNNLANIDTLNQNTDVLNSSSSSSIPSQTGSALNLESNAEPRLDNHTSLLKKSTILKSKNLPDNIPQSETRLNEDKENIQFHSKGLQEIEL